MSQRPGEVGKAEEDDGGDGDEGMGDPGEGDRNVRANARAWNLTPACTGVLRG